MNSKTKADLFYILDHSPDEAEGLKSALIEGWIEGSLYEGPFEIYGIKPHHLSPVEQFFLNIKKSDTPENNGESKLAVEWIDEWLAKNTEKTT